MDAPWIESGQCEEEVRQPGAPSSDYGWQALFACQVQIPTHEEWLRLRWGFNAGALFDEAIERQRHFLESQYCIRNDMRLETPDLRTLAFRYIQRPGEGLLFAVLGKIRARTQAEAIEGAAAYYRELGSTFPYDYRLMPACTREQYHHLAGHEILHAPEGALQLAQIQRVELPAVPHRKSPTLHGLWQSGSHGCEPIWRSLAAATQPLMMNISLRSTIIYEREASRLVESAREIAEIDDSRVSQKTLAAIQQWNAQYTDRYLLPWKKFFYLQIHLASVGKPDENFFRIIGSSLTRGKDGQSVPGYQVVVPRREDEALWRKKLSDLDLSVSTSRLLLPRLTDVADMDEVIAVMRIPYSPPDNGFPDVRFAGTLGVA